MVILMEIQAEGYPGGMTILRQYVGLKRALRPSRASNCRAIGVRWSCLSPANQPECTSR